MHPDVRVLLGAVQSHDDKLTAMQSTVQELPNQISKAVEAAILRSVSSEAMWSAAGAAIQRQARDSAGGWLFGGLASTGRRMLWVAFAVLAIYMIGGWAAVAAIVKSWGASG